MSYEKHPKKYHKMLGFTDRPPYLRGIRVGDKTPPTA
jgi:hypothetical protein